jgi:predicted negative regulator of RcsB-dependent stress response
MAVYDLEEQEQLEELKTWWKQHGQRVTTVVVVVALGIAAWQGWNLWQGTQSSQAATLYGGVEKAVAAGDARHARELAGEVIDKFPRTPYASMGALLSAKIQVEKGEAKNATAQLQWVVDHATDDALRDLAALRLATLLLDDKSYDAALKLLSLQPLESFGPRFAELKGDVLAASGKVAEARTSYQSALALLDKGDNNDAAGVRSAYREILRTKLDALGAGK